MLFILQQPKKIGPLWKKSECKKSWCHLQLCAYMLEKKWCWRSQWELSVNSTQWNLGFQPLFKERGGDFWVWSPSLRHHCGLWLRQLKLCSSTWGPALPAAPALLWELELHARHGARLPLQLYHLQLKLCCRQLIKNSNFPGHQLMPAQKNITKMLKLICLYLCMAHEYWCSSLPSWSLSNS